MIIVILYAILFLFIWAIHNREDSEPEYYEDWIEE